MEREHAAPCRRTKPRGRERELRPEKGNKEVSTRAVIGQRRRFHHLFRTGIIRWQWLDLAAQSCKYRKASADNQRVPRWDNPDILSSYVHLQKVSGAMTNAVFFVSFNPSRNPTSPSMSPLLTPTMPPSDPDLPLSPAQFPPTLLLRIYGPSSDALISRTEELRILHVLSTQYGLGPKVFGTFANGRVEQFFPSRALTSQELRDKAVSRGIARRMRELHSVDMMALGYQEEDLEVPTVWKSINEWIPAAKEVLTTLGAHGGRWEMWVENVALHRLPEEIETYKKWMMEQESSRLVFARKSTGSMEGQGWRKKVYVS